MEANWWKYAKRPGNEVEGNGGSPAENSNAAEIRVPRTIQGIIFEICSGIPTDMSNLMMERWLNMESSD